mmetsp:Transcript_6008/g.12030  ORF Transcript_6008/g.12030 Transcript_6008/m.12030 type:complete len:125 (+) Transcript_6008:896-1270(+)
MLVVADTCVESVSNIVPLSTPRDRLRRVVDLVVDFVAVAEGERGEVVVEGILGDEGEIVVIWEDEEDGDGDEDGVLPPRGMKGAFVDSKTTMGWLREMGHASLWLLAWTISINNTKSRNRILLQ